MCTFNMWLSSSHINAVDILSHKIVVCEDLFNISYCLSLNHIWLAYLVPTSSLYLIHIDQTESAAFVLKLTSDTGQNWWLMNPELKCWYAVCWPVVTTSMHRMMVLWYLPVLTICLKTLMKSVYIRTSLLLLKLWRRYQVLALLGICNHYYMNHFLSMQALTESLQALQTDYIDLYQVCWLELLLCSLLYKS